MSCKIDMLFRDLKSNRAIVNHTGVQDKVIQRCAPATFPASNSSTKPIKGLKNYQDLECMYIFGSDQLERDSLKDFVA